MIQLQGDGATVVRCDPADGFRFPPHVTGVMLRTEIGVAPRSMRSGTPPQSLRLQSSMRHRWDCPGGTGYVVNGQKVFHA